MYKVVISAAFAVLMLAIWRQTDSFGAGQTAAGLRGAAREAKASGVHETLAQIRLKPFFYGNSLCAGESCHGRLTPVSETDKEVRQTFARLHERTVWYKSDKHKDATNVLKDGLGRDIAKRLGIPTEPVDLHKDKLHWKQCLNCHGVYLEADDEQHVHMTSFAPPMRSDSGVSCVVCHGAHKEWVSKHLDPIESDAWLKLTSAEKETKFGLRNLWDPEKRAALCTSCHIGNAADGKVVTHEMYAAGHPPLPGFEIATFSEAMPRHWETWAEKLRRRPKFAELYAKAYNFNPQQGQAQIEQARMLAVSAAVAFRESMNLAADQAEGLAKVNDKALAWPELAAFDCYACHHDLKKTSWRQQRGYKGIPGRPQLRDWPLALLHVGMDHLAQASPPGDPALTRQGFEKEHQKLIAALDQHPFGDPKSVASTARALAKWSDGLIQRLDKETYRGADADRLLRAITNYAQKETVDFDSARQLAWAFSTLKMEMETRDMKSDTKPLYKVFMQKRFPALNQLLNLTLPEGQQQIAGQFMGQTMKQIRDYEPKTFRDNLR